MAQAIDGGGKRRRLFVAIGVDEKTRGALEHAATRLRALGLRGRYVVPQNYHFTVAFLGYVEPAIVERLGETLRAAAKEVARFDLALERVGAFPNERRPRVAWAGPRRPNPAFAGLCASVWSGLEPLGFVPDREAEPHVTLCRCERDSALPHVEFAPRTVHVGALTLFESHLSRDGPRYVELELLPLAEPGTSEPATSAR